MWAASGTWLVKLRANKSITKVLSEILILSVVVSCTLHEVG